MSKSPYPHEAHPQAEKDEAFLGDFTDREYEALNHRSKRQGQTRPDGRSPVFVKYWEKDRHAEAEDGEVFLKYATAQQFHDLIWRTKRRGKQVGDADRYPVFISIGEREETAKRYGL